MRVAPNQGIDINERPDLELLYHDRAFSREDESEDGLFYARERLVSHLDRLAARTIEQIVEALVLEERAEMLDLMASWDSHIPSSLEPGRVVGLGLNRVELEHNVWLDERVIHDLNRDPRLPLADASFDVVLNTVSVDYIIRPFDLFREVGRVLRPGGLFLVTFSNRMFPQKAVRVWRETSEAKRVHLVQDYFQQCEMFGETRVFVIKGRERPASDRYAELGIPSDPVYAVYADRLGGPARPRPALEPLFLRPSPAQREEVERRRARIAETLECPYCGERMRRWAVPQTPFTEWESEFVYICFNDACPYLVRGWSVMASQGNLSFSYRAAYHPDRDVLGAMPVQGLTQLRESIVEG
jgi:SAM-dependent methyltransferase